MKQKRPLIGNEMISSKANTVDLRRVQKRPVVHGEFVAPRDPLPGMRPLYPVPPTVRPNPQPQTATQPVQPTHQARRPKHVPQLQTKTRVGTKPKLENAVLDHISYGTLILAVLAAIALLTPLINWAFLVYLIAALALKISSQRIFGLALYSLILIPVLSILQRSTMANNFAIFAFYILVIGIIRAIIELKHDKVAS